MSKQELQDCVHYQRLLDDPEFLFEYFETKKPIPAQQTYAVKLQKTIVFHIEAESEEDAIEQASETEMGSEWNGAEPTAEILK